MSHNPLRRTCAMRIVYFNTSGINKSALAKADDEIVHHLPFWTGLFYKKQTIYEVSNVFIVISILSIPRPLCRCEIYSGASVPSVSMTALIHRASCIRSVPSPPPYFCPTHTHTLTRNLIPTISRGCAEHQLWANSGYQLTLVEASLFRMTGWFQIHLFLVI